MSTDINEIPGAERRASAVSTRAGVKPRDDERRYRPTSASSETVERAPVVSDTAGTERPWLLEESRRSSGADLERTVP